MTADPGGLVAGIQATLGGMFAQFDILDDEAAKTIAGHPDAADLIHHASDLFAPTHPLMSTPFVYRGHVRELLARVAAGQDTRPGTAAEVALVCSATSLTAPLTAAGVGLYCRSWLAAFPDDPIDGFDMAAQVTQSEWSAGADEINGLDRAVRRRAAQPWRRLPKDVECDGTHRGEPAACRFAKAQGGLW